MAKCITTRPTSQRLAETPAIRGPFRGLIITFSKQTNFKEFYDIYPSISFEHPNFYFCKYDKFKCIVYYKYPYDVATLISKYETVFKCSIYYDELTKTLQHDVLYVVTTNTNKLLEKTKQLNGNILYKTQIGFQIKFEDFKMTAIAHEELRKEFSVKFAYKSEVNKHLNPIKITRFDEEKFQLKSEIKILLKKYEKSPTENQYQNEFKEFCSRENTIIHEKIKKVSENLELANVSWNDAINDSIENVEKVESDSENVLEELVKLYNRL